ncbi:MAG: sigma-70 family RNA polymerase sigma factor [Isosphaeraceae bacterium]|nr:sigma-70 family RNA polymerase sigma factor [Isosphaeraceae bacterium]
MMSETDDRALIAACRAGRSDAFGALVQRYQSRLYPTALRLTGRPEDALDLLQDAFLRAFEKLGGFHGESSFYTWLYRITVNLALSERRRKSSRIVPRVASDAGPEPEDRSIDHEPSSSLERAELDRAVQSALDALAPDHRAVIVMKEFDGLRYEEIAALLDVPVGTVRSRLHRARHDLRERLRSLSDSADVDDRVDEAPAESRLAAAAPPPARVV